MVMYAGRAVEQATDEVFYDPLMPYSWSLLRSLPPGYRGRGEAPPDRRYCTSLIFLPRGMQLQPPLSFVKDECHETDPDLEEKKPGHTAACILSVEEIEENKPRGRRAGVET